MIDEELDRYGKSSFASKWLIVCMIEIIALFAIIPFVFSNDEVHFLLGLSALSFFLLSQTFVLYTIFAAQRIVIEATAAYPLPEDKYEMIWDILEDISIASGINPPQILIIDESIRNAFSMQRWGRSYIFLTKGLINRLDHDELQSVIAHEIAHIKIGDASIFNLMLNYIYLVPYAFRSLIKRVFYAFFVVVVFSLPFIFYLLLVASHMFWVPIIWLAIGAIISLAVIGLISSPQYVIARKVNYDFIADEQAVRWTLNPLAMVDAIFKTGTKCESKNYRFLKNIAFVPIYTGLDYVPLEVPPHGTPPSVTERIENLGRIAHRPL